MPVVKIHIPDEMDKAISSFTSHKEKFILEAIEQKLREEKRSKLTEELVEGYTAIPRLNFMGIKKAVGKEQAIRTPGYRIYFSLIGKDSLKVSGRVVKFVFATE